MEVGILDRFIAGNPILSPFSYFFSEGLPRNHTPLPTHGRFSLHLILRYFAFEKKRDIRGVFLPKYICHEVPTFLKEQGYKIRFYDLDSDYNPDLSALEKTLDATDSQDWVLLAVHFFGRIIRNLNEMSLLLKEREIWAIEDCAHLPYPYTPDPNFEIFRARFHILRKTYALPEGSPFSVDRVFTDFESWYQKQESRTEPGHLSLGRWLPKQITKQAIVRLKIPMAARFRDLSSESLPDFDRCDPWLEKSLRLEDASRAIHLRRANWVFFRELLGDSIRWATPLNLAGPHDVPYQALFHIQDSSRESGLIIRDLRARGIAAAPGQALSNEVLSQFEPRHPYLNQFTLPIHQSLKEEDLRFVFKILQGL